MPSYKLTYFNAKGLAEMTRLMFAQAGVEYEDIRIEKDKWPEMKASTPLGQLPILQVGDEIIPQSKAIGRFVAHELGFYGTSHLEQARIDVVVEVIDEVIQGMRAFFIESDDAIKAKKTEAYYAADGPGPSSMAKLVKLLGSHQYFVGDEISVADFCMVIAVDWYIRSKSDAMADFPTITAQRQYILALPKIAAWIAKRPETEF